MIMLYDLDAEGNKFELDRTYKNSLTIDDLRNYWKGEIKIGRYGSYNKFVFIDHEGNEINV